MNIHSAIQDAIKKCNLVFFVGAGFSRSLGLPNWTELVKIITDDLKRDYPDDTFIGNIVDMIRQKYYTEIEALDKLKPKHLARILDILERTINGVDLSKKDLSRHEKIWQITDQVITTNYDEAFEMVAPDKSPKVVYEDDYHIAQLSGMDGFLFKVHGSIEHPAKCVLFSDQYKKLYNEQTGAAFELFKMLSDKTIIFLGFSLNDPHVNDLLTLRAKAYGGLKKNHFIITTDNRDFSEFGVERIASVNNYGADLDEFLDELVLIRENYLYGLGMLIRGLIRQGKDFNIEVLRKNYFDLLASLEEKPETAAVAEEVKAGEFGNAEEKLRTELEAELKIAQESHEKAAEKAYELAKLKKLQLKYRESLVYYQQAVGLRPNDSTYHNDLGIMLRELGQFGKAIEHYEKAQAINREMHGEENSDIATQYNNIGVAWWGLGEYAKAIEYYEKAREIDGKIHGENHAFTASRYSNIGVAWADRGEYEKAIGYFEKALAIDLEVNGDNLPAIARDYNNIGAAWGGLGEYTKAIEYYEKAGQINREIHEEKHPRIAIAYNNIGAAWRGLGEYTKAIEYYEKAREIDVEVYGENHPAIARTYNNIGFAWSGLGEYRKAIEYYEKALAISLEFHGNEHPNTRTIAKNLKKAQEEAFKK